MIDLDEEKQRLKNLKANGNINNLTYQYYETVTKLANVKTMKDQLLKAQKQNVLSSEDFDVTNQMGQRRIKLSRKNFNIAGNSTSLKTIDESNLQSQNKLMPAVILKPSIATDDTDESEYIQLPTGLLTNKPDNTHKVVKEETHLLTPGKTPKIKIISSKNSTKNKVSKVSKKTAFKERDLNTMKKNLNLRDILSVKTRYDVSPVNKGDFLADLKPISKSKKL